MLQNQEERSRNRGGPNPKDGMVGPKDVKLTPEDKLNAEERKAREEEEKKNQELLLEYLDKGRIKKIIDIGPLQIEIATNLHDEEVLAQQVADEKGLLMYQLRCLGAVIAIPRVNDQSLTMIDFEKDDYEKQREKLMQKYDFFRKNKGAAILDVVIDSHLALEQKIRAIMTAERLKNW